MQIRIGDGFMCLEIDGRVAGTATERAGGWREVSYWRRFFDRNQAITALTVTELLESGAIAMTRWQRRSARTCCDRRLTRSNSAPAVAMATARAADFSYPSTDHAGDGDQACRMPVIRASRSGTGHAIPG